jgi:hypothetical protein
MSAPRAISPRCCCALLTLALSVFVALGWQAGPARAATGPQMLEFHVADGEGWHWEEGFTLAWKNEPGPEPAAVLYQLLDAEGSQVGPTWRRPGGLPVLSRVRVPKPGVYTIEAWLEGPSGVMGPHATATLRWDDSPPGGAIPLAPSSWIAGSERAIVRLTHPPGPYPISGIRGYAISVDRGEESFPCVTLPACTHAEIDLAGGIDDDSISLGTLPEGVNFVRAVAVSGSGVRSRQVASAPVYVDATAPRTELSGVPAGWAGGPVTITAGATDALSGMGAAGADGPFTAIAVDGHTPSRSPGDSVSAVVAGEGVHEVTAFARDAAGNVADGSSSSPSPTRAVVRIDETPPRVAFASFQDPADPERIEATVLDGLSGPGNNRGSIAVRPGGSRASFEQLPTTVEAGRLLARWESDAYPAGSYEFRATAFDRAGNSGASGSRLNGSRMVLGNPLKVPVTVESGFGAATMRWRICRHSHRRTRCVPRVLRSFEVRPAEIALPYGHGIAFSGRVVSALGAPLEEAQVAIVQTFASGAVPSRAVALVRTDASGSFTYRLPPGPSREVVASFAGDRLASRATGQGVHLAVRSALALHASASSARIGGRPVVFRGRVAAAGTRIPPTGLPVELQFRYPGAGWSEFRTVQTDAGGRFRYAYAFTDDDSRGVRFQFRAHVAAVDGWPYDPGSSRPVFVAGR